MHLTWATSRCTAQTQPQPRRCVEAYTLLAHLTPARSTRRNSRLPRLGARAVPTTRSPDHRLSGGPPRRGAPHQSAAGRPTKAAGALDVAVACVFVHEWGLSGPEASNCTNPAAASPPPPPAGWLLPLCGPVSPPIPAGPDRGPLAARAALPTTRLLSRYLFFFLVRLPGLLRHVFSICRGPSLARSATCRPKGGWRTSPHGRAPADGVGGDLPRRCAAVAQPPPTPTPGPLFCGWQCP